MALATYCGTRVAEPLNWRKCWWISGESRCELCRWSLMCDMVFAWCCGTRVAEPLSWYTCRAPYFIYVQSPLLDILADELLVKVVTNGVVDERLLARGLCSRLICPPPPKKKSHFELYRWWTSFIIIHIDDDGRRPDPRESRTLQWMSHAHYIRRVSLSLSLSLSLFLSFVLVNKPNTHEWWLWGGYD